MARFGKIKIILFLVAVVIVLWNYFLRTSINLPYLSTLDSIVVYLVALAVFLLGIIIHYLTRYSY